MCLTVSNTAKFLIANDDIVCYKVLRKNVAPESFMGNKYRTPYKEFAITIGNTYQSNLLKEGSEINYGIHSFKKLPDAILECESFNSEFDCKLYYVVAKCIVPKGSLYYKGLFKNGIRETAVDSIASNELKYLAIVSTETI